MTAQSDLITQVRAVLDEAIVRLEGDERSPALIEARQRLDEPLRIAIAGQVKAGKSTLLNALVGEELAATDAGECTRIVTWYREGISRSVTLRTTDGGDRPVPFERTERGLAVDLDGVDLDTIEGMSVSWPSSALETMTLIDTPGIGSATIENSARTAQFLLGGEDTPTAADAVVYLMRHMHATDMEFLEAFRDTRVGRATPTNAIAVVARADEIGAGQLNAMASAERIAERYAADPKLRRVAATAMPVAALIGQAGAALRERDYQLLGAVAALQPDVRHATLLSVDRFVSATIAEPAELRQLLDRLGMFGVRLAVAWIASNQVASASHLARALVSHSGLPRLKAELFRCFGTRRDILKARSALTVLEPIGLALERAGDRWLAGEVERILAGAHEFVEIRLATALRSGTVPVSPSELDDMEQLLGLRGMTPTDRVGLDEQAEPTELRSAIHHHLGRWQRRAESPMSDPTVTAAAQVLVRTCEGLLTRADG